jgi:Zn-dependent peptidase ImmA (M78 family)
MAGMEERVRKLKERLGVPPDQHPVDVLAIASGLGVKVYDTEFATPEVSALVVTNQERVPGWVVPGERATLFVAKNKPPFQKVLVVAHGLGHVILGHVGEEGLRTELLGGGIPCDPQAEREANSFATALLMPEIPFRRAWEALAERGVHYVAAVFGVSVNAVAIRAQELGLEVPLP